MLTENIDVQKTVQTAKVNFILYSLGYGTKENTVRQEKQKDPRFVFRFCVGFSKN